MKRFGLLLKWALAVAVLAPCSSFSRAATLDPVLKPKAGLAPFEYEEADVPFYDPGRNPKLGTTLIKQMQKPLTPEESARHIAVLPGFEAKLFAAEPLIYKPICMAFDERGRLWIAETLDYPNEMKPPGEGRDRIVIVEDTKGSGAADKVTVFADHLSIPTSIVFANGGIIVQQAPDTLFLKSSKGDDHADIRQILFSGWGTKDTHAGPSNLRWGFDNWIWGMVGYSGFRGTVGSQTFSFQMGFYRFKPDGSTFEFVRSSNNNTWGIGLAEDTTIFGSTANNNPSMYMPIANRHYEAVNGWSARRLETIASSTTYYPITEKIRQVDVHGGYTAAAGHALYTARSFPKEYWNRIAFVTEPTGHLVGKFEMEPNGADFTARNSYSFLASDDEWTAPIMAEVGPDGALWVIDWYNYIVQHNPTPTGFKTGKGSAYETPLRDKTHGRIYRVSYKAGKPSKQPHLDKSAPQELVAALANDNLLWRMHAQRMLVERVQKDVVQSLIALARNPGVDEIGLNVGVIHALWTLHGLGALEPSNQEAVSVATADLKHRSAGVRRTALNVLPRTEETAATILKGNLLKDPDAQVRMAAFLALAEMPGSDTAGAAIFAALNEDSNARDRWIPQAATAAAAKSDAGFLKAALASVKADNISKPAEPANLLPNPSFENEAAGQPVDWKVRTYSGTAEHKLSDIGHTGTRSVRIESTTGSDTSWYAKANLEPNTDYRLSAWIKTSKITGASGALLNVHELQDVKTPSVNRSTDWMKVETTFNSGGRTNVTINCLFGGWGRATGTAWYDDIELVAVGSGLPMRGEIGQAVRIVTGHYASRVPVESVVPTLFALQSAAPAMALPILDGLVSGWPKGTAPKLNPGDESKLVVLLKALPQGARGRLVALADRWGRADIFSSEVAAITQLLRQQVVDASLPEAARLDAAHSLIGLEDAPGSIQTVLGQITPETSLALATGFVNALGESSQPETAKSLIQRWADLTPASRRAAITTLLHRPDWAYTLLRTVERGPLTHSDIPAEYWQQLKSQSDPRVSGLARRLDQTTAASSAEMEALVKKLLPIAGRKGDAKRGQQVFETICINCHTLNGKGAKIGPELTGIGIRPRADILIDIIDPNRSVEANFRLTTVNTKDGNSYSGRLETETQTTIEVLDLTGQTHTVQRKDIAKLETSQLSIMPTGFDQLPPADLAGVLEYLAQYTEPKK